MDEDPYERVSTRYLWQMSNKKIDYRICELTAERKMMGVGSKGDRSKQRLA